MLRDIPTIPQTEVSREALDRAKAAVSDLLTGTPIAAKSAKDFGDIIELFLLLSLDLSKLEKYAIDADAALRGCVSDSPAATSVKEVK